jgi:soluble cytochrome b562
MLLGLPKSANCSTVFWPLVSASGRLYCAELKAEERTAESLLEAIALVSDLPQDHPLRAQIDNSVEEWAAEILKIGDEKFQSGNLQEAIAIAKKIPSHLQAYQLVAARIEKWEQIWTQAEETYNKVDEELRKSNWNQAFREAVKLTYLNNEYWATTKYKEAIDLISIAREESTKLDQAYGLVRRGGIDNLLKALEGAENIPPSSYAYTEAQKLIKTIEEDLTKIADDLIKRENWQELLSFTNKIPTSLNIQSEVSIWSQLSKAALSAASGTMNGLQTALVQAQDIPETSPLYDKARSLVALWQKERDDLTHISKAQELAAIGTPASLTSAIAEAELVPNYNPRYQQAQGYIKDWIREIQVIEDQPILDRAKQMGISNNPQTLQEAIAQASLIRQGRALYPEAQRNIAQWRANIQRQQDQPILDQANGLANRNNLTAAIQTAQQIQSGRALYQEAQSRINSWQREIRGQQMLDEARTIASQGNLDSLTRAMKIVSQIPNNTRAKNEASASLNNWSEQVLRFAESQANSSVSQAIAIANNIPSGTSAYTTARQRIKTWQNIQQESQGRNTLREAANIATRGTPDALVRAINIARQIPSSTEVRKDSVSVINNWSYQILRIAEIKANSSLEEAIAIAQKVPSGTSAYQSAQNQISSWQRLLQPSAVDIPVIQPNE